MKIFKDKWFTRFARRNDITDGDLCEAVDRAERGLIDADLGGGVIKQRIPRLNEGRSGGYRSIVLFRTRERAFFVFGFAKNELDNISARELKDFRELATIVLNLTAVQLELAVKEEKLFEVKCDE
ncbi:type II toxin-antitoxin system RelE/ParE family toxin [bacterium]|nr:MAG: type II toxin-antitoxin system RelE/ParE family toxin [bacterium]